MLNNTFFSFLFFFLAPSEGYSLCEKGVDSSLYTKVPNKETNQTKTGSITPFATDKEGNSKKDRSVYYVFMYIVYFF